MNNDNDIFISGSSNTIILVHYVVLVCSACVDVACPFRDRVMVKKLSGSKLEEFKKGEAFYEK